MSLHSKPFSPSENPQFIQSGKILNEAILKKGGSVGIIPFTAGTDVEATPQLDRVSFMMIKGFSQVLNQSDSQKIIFTQESDDADFIVMGHITQITQPSKFNEWVLGKHKIILSVDGKMIEASTKETVLVFSDTQSIKNKKSNYEELGQTIGSNVGKFLLTNIKP